MDFFITLALILGLFIVPGLINYYVNRYFTPPGTSSAPTSELVTASLTLTFAILVLDVAAVLLIALGWDDLRDDIADFVQMGLLDFARDRPIALTGVLSAYSVSCMAILGLLGVLRVPSRWIR
ncbi:MAG: hypothetical protein IIC91_04675 [Chloroflexi bacterium]|nr:hypothetical protein [Chloroflexota bacterium]MCH8008137.1 hypothetical protein [Chloroflexota bacterium]